MSDASNLTINLPLILDLLELHDLLAHAHHQSLDANNQKLSLSSLNSLQRWSASLVQLVKNKNDVISDVGITLMTKSLQLCPHAFEHDLLSWSTVLHIQLSVRILFHIRLILNQKPKNMLRPILGHALACMVLVLRCTLTRSDLLREVANVQIPKVMPALISICKGDGTPMVCVLTHSLFIAPPIVTGINHILLTCS